MQFTPVSVNAFYGNSPKIEETAGIINDLRRRLRLERSLGNAPEKEPVQESMPEATAPVQQLVDPNTTANNGDTQSHEMTADAEGGAIKFGSAIAFNESQLQNELSNVKKGGALGALAASIIPALISAAPSIIDSIKGLKKGSGLEKCGGASAVFLKDVDPKDYDEYMDLFKKIKAQSKYVTRTGSGIIAGSGKVGQFFSNAWSKLKSFYGNNKDKFQPIVDILANSAKNYASKAVDKAANYIGEKTGNNDTVKQITSYVADQAKTLANKGIESVQNYGNQGSGCNKQGCGLATNDSPTFVKNVKKIAKHRRR